MRSINMFLIVTLVLTVLTPTRAENAPSPIYAPTGQPLATIVNQMQLECREQQRISKAWADSAGEPHATPAPIKTAGPTHIIFTFVDHWEPGPAGQHSQDLARMWRDDYATMAARHHDADGRMPQHNWFCAYLDTPQLQIISEACFRGLGEMDIHIHHGTEDDSQRDNSAEMSGLLDTYLSKLNHVGACRTTATQPRSSFGYIHGLWALDNSRNFGKRQWCGVNREIDMLIDKQCYADFTFPAWGTMTPLTMLDKIYYTKDSNAPKSYDEPSLLREVTAGSPPPAANEFMIFEGPNTNTNIDQNDVPTLARMDDWVRHAVHVPGRNDWIFIKVYTHSAQSIDAGGYDNLIGAVADRFYRDIETKYNDGVRFQLHYATGRELYNMARAAQDGHQGSPNLYRDYIIEPPANTKIRCNALYNLLSYDRENHEVLIELFGEKPDRLRLSAHEFNQHSQIFEASSIDKSQFQLCNGNNCLDSKAGFTLDDDSPSQYYLLRQASVSEETATGLSWPLY